MSETLPATRDALLNALVQTKQDISSAVSDGVQFLKFSKGEWLFGADMQELAEDDVFVVNVKGIRRGFIAWPEEGGAPLGEEMSGLFETPIVREQLPEVGADWTVQFSFELLCIQGEDKGEAMRFTTNSQGGRNACSRVLTEIIDKVKSGDEEYLPALKLGVSSYVHKKKSIGKVWTPVLDIVGWYAEDDTEEDVEEVAVEKAEPVTKVEEKPKRRRLRR